MSKRSIGAVSPESVRDSSDYSPRDEANGSSGTASSNKQPPAVAPAPPKRTTTCAHCRRLKVKCILQFGCPPCNRCKKKNILCDVSASQRNSVLSSRQMALLGRDLSKVHSTLSLVCKKLNLEAPKVLEASAGMQDDGEDEAPQEPEPVSPGAPAPIGAYLGGPDIPPSAPELQARAYKPDLVGRNVITLEEAEALTKVYYDHLDTSMYGIVSAHKNLKGLRDASPVLLAAVCTVAAMHHADYDHLYERCYREFRRLVSTSMFDTLDIEHIRGLVVGSYWLPGTSRILLCEAVRRAGDVRLHRAIGKAVEATRGANDQAVQESRDRVRLWYVMFVCDQYQAILNNHEALLSVDADILQRRGDFVRSPAKSTQDSRLVAQCSLLAIMSRIKCAFGSESSDPLDVSARGGLIAFMSELDGWFAAFAAKDTPTSDMTPGLKQAFPLHCSFARLYLGHHVFRAMRGAPLPPEFVTVGRLAYDAAVTIFYLIINFNIIDGLWSTPAYVHIMISFAGHLLIEVIMNYKEQLNVQVEREFKLLEVVVNSVGALKLSSHHPLKRIGAALRKKLFEFAAMYGRERLDGQHAQYVQHVVPPVSAILSDMAFSDISAAAFLGDS